MKDGIIKKLDSFAKKFLKERTKELKKYAKRENELIYNDIVLNLINKLQKENEELKTDNYELNNRITDLSKNIPVQKIKDKIRKNEEIIDISNDGDLIHELYQENKVYKELLESEE